MKAQTLTSTHYTVFVDVIILDTIQLLFTFNAFCEVSCILQYGHCYAGSLFITLHVRC